MIIDKILLSSNTNPTYLSFWPVVKEAWELIFDDVQVELALVVDGEIPDWLWSVGPVYTFPMIQGLPVANVSKMARHFLASYQADDAIVMLNDVDVLPLNGDYIDSLLHCRPDGHLLAYGTEHYKGPEKGKWWLPYTTAEGRIFKKLVNPRGLTWTEFIDSFRKVHKFDQKEDIENPIPNTHPDCFSDESVYRMLLAQNPVPVKHVERPHYPGSTLDRANWPGFDVTKVKAGRVFDAHPPRPVFGNEDKIVPMLEFLRETGGSVE